MGPGTFKPAIVPNIGLGTFKPGSGIYNPVTVQKPFIDPSKGIEQFFDENGPGPTPVDRANWDAINKSKTDIGRGGFPEIEKKILKKQEEQSSIKGMVSNFFKEFFSGLKSTLFIIIIIALGTSFAFFYLKSVAERGKI